ncbi:MAG: hypothetical protein ACPGWR_08065 [Ardenticatenaceae bacterium]
MMLFQDGMIHGGGRAGVRVDGWQQAGYNLEELESLRQHFLRQNDIGAVQRAMRQVGISVDRATLHLVKRYNFDSQGIGFSYLNFAAWRRLVSGKGTIGDATYIVHEMAEIKELRGIQQQTSFDFMGKGVQKLPRKPRRRWESDFDRYYKLSHSKALEAEYEFLIKEVNRYVSDPKLKITKLQAAAIDPTRRIKGFETEAARHMFVDGVAMKRHHHYNAWRGRANELVPLNKRGQRKLKVKRTEIRVDDLIRLVRHQKIK